MSDVRPFQVDLRGVVDLLSRHMYSSPRVYLRELLQNARDAIAARHLLDGGAPAGRVTVSVEGSLVTVSDNGIGLTADEAADLLATVGRSSKRDEVLGFRRDDFLGQFGIGMLSCFLVADDIVVRSRSATGEPAIEWVGSADGTFRVTTLGSDLPIGTRVEVRVRPDQRALAEPEQVRRLLSYFGEFLPDEITFEGTRINHDAPFLSADRDEIEAFGRQLIGATPIDTIPLSVPATATRGVAYVLPYAPPPGAHQSHRVYLGRMLLGERVPDLVPQWAFFIRCVVDTNGLSPTASREALVENAALDFTRDEIGNALRSWIVTLASTDPMRFNTFVTIHQLALKSMALYDDELARVLLPYILVETSAGSATLGDLIAAGRTVRYAETVDEFRQVAAVVSPNDPVVNAGYTLDANLMRRLPQVFAEASTHRLRVNEVLSQLDPVPLDERSAAVALETASEDALTNSDAQVITRCFEPTDLNAIFVSDPSVLRRLERRTARDLAAPSWAAVLDEVDEITGEAAPTRAQLCLNWSNPLIQELAGVDDPVVRSRSIRLLYVQALLASHHPLRAEDRRLLSEALVDLIHLSVLRTD